LLLLSSGFPGAGFPDGTVSTGSDAGLPVAEVISSGCVAAELPSVAAGGVSEVVGFPSAEAGF